MERNLGTADRTVRLLLGPALVVAGSLGLAGLLAGAPSFAFAVATLVGVVLFVTGLVGGCPLYRLVGLDACPRQSDGFPP